MCKGYVKIYLQYTFDLTTVDVGYLKNTRRALLTSVSRTNQHSVKMASTGPELPEFCVGLKAEYLIPREVSEATRVAGREARENKKKGEQDALYEKLQALAENNRLQKEKEEEGKKDA